MSCEDPDRPANWPRNLFVWRSNLLGSSGKGHEYFLKHLLGTDTACMGKDLGEEGAAEPKEAVWHDEAPEGKLDLLVTLDFRMSTTCVYSDIVLPTASWYEKNDLNTPTCTRSSTRCSGGGPGLGEPQRLGHLQGRSPRKFSEVAPEVLGREGRGACPILHDTPGEMAQPRCRRTGKGRSRTDPRQDHAAGARRSSGTIPTLYKRFTALGPLMEKLGNGGKGIAWNTEHEVDILQGL